MKVPPVTRRMKTIIILSMLLLAVGGSLAAQSRTKDRVRRRAPRIFAAQTGPDQVTLAWDEVPGTTEYRIYLPDLDKPGPPAPGSRPTMSFSGSGRRATVMGVQRMASGAYLEALAQGEVLYRGTFNAIARAPLARPTAPAAVQARESGETEVTLSWNPVPGATAYTIGRAAGGSGLQMLCDVCPPSGEFVDTTATPGLEHTYTVAAIFPLGISTRTFSNRLTVGAAQLAAATASAPPAAAWDKPMSTGTPVSVTDANDSNVGASAGTTTAIPGQLPTTTPITTTQTTNTPTGWMPSGVSGSSGNVTNQFTPGGTPAAVMPVQQPPTTTATQTANVHTATPITATQTTATPSTTTQTTNNPVGGILGRVGDTLGNLTTQLSPGGGTHAATPVQQPTTTATQTTSNEFGVIGGIVDALGNRVGMTAGNATSALREVLTPGLPSMLGTAAGGLASSVSPPTSVTARVTGPGTVMVTWQASPTIGVTNYQIGRRVNSGAWELLNNVGPSTLTYSDAFFPVTLFASGPARVSYEVLASKSTAFSPAAMTGDVVVQPSAPTASIPATGTLASACKLNYQRADNMWAAFGHPDGQLGTETISLSPAQDKVFITDWKYEKTHNDGSNYYGSHLRIAANTGSHTIRLQLRSVTPTGLVVYLRTGSDTFWIRMDPGSTKQFQADLMEVFCEN